MDWKKEADRLYEKYGRQWSLIADDMKPYFPDMKHFEIKEKIRSYIRGSSKMNQIEWPVGVFGDTHIPFDHPNYLQFVKDTFKKYKVKNIVCTGDLVDHHALSRFNSEPCAKGAYDELDESIKKVNEYTNAFPKVKMCIGNHDEIPYRQAATIGIGRRYMKSFGEILELPKTWELEEEFIINNVLYKHGLNCMGKDGVINTAIQERISTVIGHSHSFGGCKYSANKRDIIFGVNVGCGIDIAAYAFAYGKHAKYRPTLGCGIVFNDSYATFIPMGEEYFRG